MPNQNSANLNIQNQLLQSLAGLSIAAGNKILMSTSGAGATAGSLDHSVGSNANGFFLRLGNYQVCWLSALRLNFLSVSTVEGTWVYPAAFKSSTVPLLIFGNLVNSGAGGADRDLSVPRSNAAGNVSTGVRVFRVSGTSDFVSGNFVDVDALAIGEWQ